LVKRIKVNYWKCLDCDFGTTIEKDTIKHGLPYLQEQKDGTLKHFPAHRPMKNIKGELIKNAN